MRLNTFRLPFEIRKCHATINHASSISHGSFMCWSTLTNTSRQSCTLLRKNVSSFPRVVLSSWIKLGFTVLVLELDCAACVFAACAAVGTERLANTPARASTIAAKTFAFGFAFIALVVNFAPFNPSVSASLPLTFCLKCEAAKRGSLRVVGL